MKSFLTIITDKMSVGFPILPITENENHNKAWQKRNKQEYYLFWNNDEKKNQKVKKHTLSCVLITFNLHSNYLISVIILAMLIIVHCFMKALKPRAWWRVRCIEPPIKVLIFHFLYIVVMVSIIYHTISNPCWFY